MTIYPVINCADFSCVKHRVEACRSFLPRGEFLHVDIADARFTFGKSWGSPALWKRLRIPFPAEIHLMVEHPERVAEEWLKAGAKRLIVHIETLSESRRGHARDPRPALHAILAACRAHKAELMLALSPETPVYEMKPFMKQAKFFQVLAVEPGPPAQEMIPSMIPKIAELRKILPKNAKIEVDGGIILHTARAAKRAGADIVVSGSYLFNSPHPALVYRKFREI